jgi:hypothetical protein
LVVHRKPFYSLCYPQGGPQNLHQSS